MKTERRHELQHNDLVELAGKYAGDVKPHAKKIVGIAIIVAVGLLALMFMRQQGRIANEQSWTSYFAAASQSDLEGLYEVAKKYPRTNAGAWAMQSAGDINLATGTVNLYSDRTEAMERLEKAKENYSQAKSRAKETLLRQRAMMGLAQTYEAMNQFDEAEKIYSDVSRSWPDSTVAKLAADRASIITNPETSEFYDWFMAQDLQPPADPLGGMQVKPPSVYDDLPGDSSLTAPSADELLEGRNTMDAPEESIEDSPVPEAPLDSEFPETADPPVEPADAADQPATDPAAGDSADSEEAPVE